MGEMLMKAGNGKAVVEDSKLSNNNPQIQSI
jgi:hypothetical protein